MNRTNNTLLTTRQLCFILAFFLPVTKLVLLPSTLAAYAENDLLLSALLVFLLQGGAMYALLWLMERKQKTLFALLEEKFGAWVARIAYFILALYFLFSSVLPLAEHKLYIQNTLYDTLPSLLVFLPFFFFSTYAGAKSLRCTGRAADVGMPLFFLSLPPLLFMAIASADFTSLLPVGFMPAGSVLQGASRSLSWCSDAAWLLVFLGNVRVEKRFKTKTFLSYIFGGLVVLFFLAVFYGIFSTTAINEPFAVAKIARYYNALKTLGRIDFLFLYILLLVQLFALVVPIQLCVHTLAVSFRSDKRPLFSLLVNILLFAVILLTDDAFPTLEETINGMLFPVFLLFGTLLPLLSPLLACGKGKSAPHEENPAKQQGGQT